MDRLRVSRCETKIKTKINEIEKDERTGRGEKGAGERKGGSLAKSPWRGPRGGRRAGQ